MKELLQNTSDMPGDSGYGCAVANRFGQLLDDESDPFDTLHQAQVEKRQKKKEDPKKASVGKTVKKESQKDRKAAIPIVGGEGDNASHANAIDQSLPGQKRRGEERWERRVTFGERRLNENESALGFPIQPQELMDRGGRGRGGVRGRGGRGGGYPRSTDGFDQRGKRVFERHSGSDKASVRPEEKRGGSGPRNWGSMKDQMSAIVDGAPEAVDTEETPEAVEIDGENRPPEMEKVAAIQMSLDEWKALQEQSRPKKEFNIRKADTSVPSKAVVIHKSKQPEEHGDAIEEDEDASVFRRPANDITAKLEINFGSLSRPSRAGRGGGGTPATEMVERAPQKKFVEVAPNPDDPEDFPALG